MTGRGFYYGNQSIRSRLRELPQDGRDGKKAAAALGLEVKIEKITDIAEIMKYTMSPPGLVINGELRHSGKPLPDLEKVKELIRQEA